MTAANLSNVTIEYETVGEGPALLLVMGLGAQLIDWPDEFVDLFVERGFQVIRFDNRDAGLSSKITPNATARPASVSRALAAQMSRRFAQADYLLADMAADAVGLLDHLGIDRAHVVGASMGGMIAQTIAIRFPERVRSLVSIMSNTGGRFSGPPAVKVYPVFLKQAPKDRAGFIEHTIRLYDAIGSPGFERDDAEMRELFEREYDRGVSAAASGRQLMAILADRDRAPQLRRLDVPALVIHGTADKLVAISGRRRTAKAIPDARMLEI